MKILIINNLWERGGTEKIVRGLAEELAVKETVAVLTIGRISSCQTREKYLHYQVSPANLFSFLDLAEHSLGSRYFWHLFNIFNWSGRRQVKKVIREFCPDLVLLHNLMGLGFLIPDLLRREKIPFIQFIHDVQLLHPVGVMWWGREKQLQTVLARFYQSLTRSLMSGAKLVVFPATWLKDLFQEKRFFSSSSLTVWPHPVLLGSLAMAQPRQRGLRLLYVGQLEQHKGINWLVETLQASSLDFSLKIIGSGSQQAVLAKIIAADSRFSLLPAKPAEQLVSDYQQADYTVVPSLVYESFSLATQESLFYGTPVLGANLGGITEQVVTGKNGFLFAPGDAVDLLRVLALASQASFNGSLMLQKVSWQEYCQNIIASSRQS